MGQPRTAHSGTGLILSGTEGHQAMRLAGGATPGHVAASAVELDGIAGLRPLLVVDDEPTIRTFLEAALRGAGYDVLAVADGRAALRAIYDYSASPALLLSDIDMPGMSGIELAARLAADRPNMPVVLMTGNPASLRRAGLPNTSVDSVLAKPFTLAELLAAVAHAIGPIEAEPAR